MIDKVKQYGFFHAIRRSFLALFRSIISYEKYVIYELSNNSFNNFSHYSCIQIDYDLVEELVNKSFITHKEATLFLSYLDQKYSGVAVVGKGILAGSAWVQLSGSYVFNRNFSFDIPCGVAIMRNLFVHPSYRGLGVGKLLNKARLSILPDGIYPISLVVFDNRYAIRNWIHLGFTASTSVSIVQIFNKFNYIGPKILSESFISSVLFKSFKVIKK